MSEEENKVGVEKICEDWDRFTKETSQKLETLETQFQQKISRDANMKEAFDRLYEEMKQYKEDFLFEAMRPVLTDLVLLHDNVIRFHKSLEDIKAQKSMEFIKEEILEILYRRNVEPVLASENGKLDRKTQRAVKTIPTTSPSEEGDIVEVIREGFWRGERIFRPQDVVAKKYQASHEETLRNQE